MTETRDAAIAETLLIMVDSSGRKRDIQVKIGRPYNVSHTEAACPVTIDGLYGELGDIYGIDTFQALALAVGFVRLTLRNWEEKGARFFIPGEEEHPLDSRLLFGELTRNSFVIGIGGPTCAGKTVLAEALAARLGDAVVVPVDAYYGDLANLPLEERAKVNFDEPAAIDHDLLIDHVRKLRTAKVVNQPLYDFTMHTRRAETKPVWPRTFILVEGLLALYWPELRDLYDASVFITAPDQECLARRTARDVRDRGRTPESVQAQFETTVRPMYDKFCRDTQQYADLILNGCEELESLVEKVVAVLQKKGLIWE